MSWSYRIVRCVTDIKGTKHIWYGLFEVFFDKKGRPYTRTEDPITFVSDDPQDLIGSIHMALKDACNRSILDDDDIKEEFDPFDPEEAEEFDPSTGV